MKKNSKIIIAVILAVALISALSVVIITNAADENIPGFSENMDKLFLKNEPEELRQFMHENLSERLEDDFYRSYLPGTRILEKANDLTDEELYEIYMRNNAVDFELGVRYYVFHDINKNEHNNKNKYMVQYAESGNFEYLIDDSTGYWMAPRTSLNGYGAFFYSDGKYPELNTYLPTIKIDGDALDFLFDYGKIEKMLLAAGETRVDDIKILAFKGPFLYIKGEQDEYLIMLQKHANESKRDEEWLGNIDRFEIYTAKEMIEKFFDVPENVSSDFKIVLELSDFNTMRATKPTYDLEAESLQADGLLYGNEKGLDLLKPLTRIEATTILVRALGYENEPTATVSKFNDIPNDNWGVKYANIAADKGITKGVGDGKFAPEQLITSNQFATLLLRNSEPTEFDWEQAINMLIERGIITQEQSETMDLFTRGDMAKIIYEAKEKGLIG